MSRKKIKGINIIHFFWSCSLVLFLAFLGQASPLNKPSLSQSHPASFIFPYHQILTVPYKKGTVGTLVFYRKNGILYVLLGREDINGTTAKAGQYCDLGGSINLDGTTLANNILRELHEESAGAFNLTPDQLKSSIILYKKTETNRDIYYALYLLSPSQFLSSEVLEMKREQAKNKNLPRSYLEKDKFLWVQVEDLLKSFKENGSSYWISAKDINGNLHHIRLREFFANDCLSHPNFEESIRKLESPFK